MVCLLLSIKCNATAVWQIFKLVHEVQTPAGSVTGPQLPSAHLFADEDRPCVSVSLFVETTRAPLCGLWHEPKFAVTEPFFFFRVRPQITRRCLDGGARATP